MNITIQSVNFKAGEQLEYFITKKVQKLFKYSDRIIRAEITLREGDNGSLQNKLCDIRLMIPGNDHFVSKASEVYEKSILSSVKTMQHLLRKSKPASMLKHAKRKVHSVFSKE